MTNDERWALADKLVFAVTGALTYAGFGWIGLIGGLGGIALGDWLLSRFRKQRSH